MHLTTLVIYCTKKCRGRQLHISGTQQPGPTWTLKSCLLASWNSKKQVFRIRYSTLTGAQRCERPAAARAGDNTGRGASGAHMPAYTPDSTRELSRKNNNKTKTSSHIINFFFFYVTQTGRTRRTSRRPRTTGTDVRGAEKEEGGGHARACSRRAGTNTITSIRGKTTTTKYPLADKNIPDIYTAVYPTLVVGRCQTQKKSRPSNSSEKKNGDRLTVMISARHSSGRTTSRAPTF